MLDTNVVSELRRLPPDANVAAWLDRQSPDDLYLAALTVGELQRGACKLGDTRRGAAILHWIDTLVSVQFADRVLPFDLRCAMRWGRMMGEHDANGLTLPTADAQIAATALEHGLVPVTRNVEDFGRMVTKVVDPFASPG